MSPSLGNEFGVVSNQRVVFFFAWKTSWLKILTLDQLKRRGMTFANRCFFCQENEETVDHLLLHCIKAKSAFGAALLSFWCFLGHFFFGSKHPIRMERVFCD